MRVPVINVNPTNLDAVQRELPRPVQRGSLDAQENAGDAANNFIDTAQFNWFLPSNIDKAGTISSVAFDDVSGVNPEGVADRVLSHIGA